MADTELWEKRVAEWKASGLTSVAYCEGKPFTAGGLRHWAHRLRREGRAPRGGKPAIRIGRVVRRRATEALPPERLPEATAVTQAAAPEALVIECGGMRLAIRPGFDREALAGVLDVLAARGGAR